MIIKLIVDGGEMKPGPAIAQKVGPLGINMGKIISEVNNATSGFKGIKVPVQVDVNPKTKNFTIQFFSPPTSELLKKELGLEKGSGLHKKQKVANASIEQIISIAKTKHSNMLERNLKSAVKSIIGTAGTLGILIENKEYKEAEEEVEKGKFDNEINAEKTETPPEKKKKLELFFEKLQQSQEEAKKKEEAEKEAAEAEKEAKKKEAEEKPEEGKEEKEKEQKEPAEKEVKEKK